jgi:hypothetical protein
MQKITLASVAVLLALALAGIAAATASAASLLVLPGENVGELKYEGKASAATLETVSGRTIACAKATVKSTFNALAGKEADSEQGAITTDFEGCRKESKTEKVSCRSETKGGEKDPIETVLVLTGSTDATEETTEKAKEFLLVASLPETQFINCGAIKEQVRGAVACLVTPAQTEVAAGGTVKIACALEKPGKPKTGKCLTPAAMCEKLAKEPLEGNLGVAFEGAAEEVIAEGSFNKMAFLDD